jgi:hypothetical protein
MTARKQGRALDAALWGVAALVAYFSLQNVTAFAVEHGTPLRTAVVLAPMVDVALVAALVADGVLSRGGVVSTGWGTLLRWFAGIATLTFNVWGSVARQDIAAVVLHAVPPLLLILLAEAAPQYRRQFAALADRSEDGPAAAGDAPGVPVLTVVSDTRQTVTSDAVPAVTRPAGDTATKAVTKPRAKTGKAVTKPRAKTGKAVTKPGRAPSLTWDEALAKGREMAASDGAIPSLRSLTGVPGMGYEKARQIREALELEGLAASDTPTAVTKPALNGVTSTRP